MNRFASDLWTGLRTGPARSGLAFLSLALGLFAVTILLSTLEALRRQAQELVQQFGAGSFVLVRSGATDLQARWTRDNVAIYRDNLAEAAWVSGVKMLPEAPGRDVPVVATDEALAFARGWTFQTGRALDAEDVRQGVRHAMTSAEMCRRQQWRTGDIILLGQEPFRLIGCFESSGSPIPSVPDSAVYIPYTADVLEAATEADVHRVGAWLFRVRPGTAPEALRRRVGVLLGHPDIGLVDVEWITPESLLSGIRRWQRAIAWTAGSGGALGLLLGAATLAGMLLTGVRERIPEIGLRRALGARRREIALLFVAEALVLTGAAALVGMLGAEATLRWLGGRFPLPFTFGWGTRLLPLALAAVIAGICSIGPAWLAARMPPAEALRNE